MSDDGVNVFRLDGGAWAVKPVGETSSVPEPIRRHPIAASVPGCVHLDLIRAGQLGHPDAGFNERDGLWIGSTDWQYACPFDLPAEALQRERLDLVFDGIDTVAAVELNGRAIGETASMFHPHRFNVRDTAREGRNELVVTLRGPLAFASQQQQRLGTRPVNGDWGPYSFVRRTACNFGWDWGPRVPTCGLWRPVRLEAWSGVRLAGVRPLVRSGGKGWQLDVAASIELLGDDGATLEAVLHHGEDVLVAGRIELPPGVKDACVTLELDAGAVKTWWPRGHGPQPLYDLHVRLRGVAGDDTWSGRVGFRTVRLDTSADEHGSAFTLVVNGRPLFCKGANWIPDGLFPAIVSRGDYRRRIEQACAANLNMLRVWGGGLYEGEAFYEACDQLGVMVWQDFMFACATYPEDDPYPALIEAEARHQVMRLSRHPSIVLWCGGNENIEAVENWGWKTRLRPGQSWGRRYFFELLPAVVAELDPTRPYWPDSPWSGDEQRSPNDPDHGDRHTWDKQIEGYAAIVPRFCTEFGHQAPPAWRTLFDAVGADALAIGSESLEFRQRAHGGSADQYDDPIAEWFTRPRFFDDWHFLAQLLQARALAIGLEWLRANTPRCMGALFWQLNDAWTGHSWSVIDSAGRLKPAWYAVRRACAPRMLTIQPVDGRPTLYAANDEAEPWRTSVRLRRLLFNGSELRRNGVPVTVEPYSAARVCDLLEHLEPPGDPREELLVAEADGVRALWFFGRDRDLALPRPDYEAKLTPDTTPGVDEYELRVRATTLLRDVVLGLDRLDPEATVDDQVVTILPGETFTWTIRSAVRPRLDLSELGQPPVLNCANRFAASPA